MCGADSAGFIHEKDGFTPDKLAHVLDLKQKKRARIRWVPCSPAPGKLPERAGEAGRPTGAPLSMAPAPSYVACEAPVSAEGPAWCAPLVGG